MLQKSILFTLVLIYSIHLPLYSQFNASLADKYILALAENNQAMGSIAISNDNKMLFEKAWGYTHIDNNKKADINTLYRIGNISQIYTAAIVLQLIEEGSLDYYTKVETFFPVMPYARTTTIGHLLQHKSGLKDITADSTFIANSKNEISKVGLIRLIVEGGSKFPSGEDTDFSSANYMVLQWILEEVTGQSFDQLLHKRIISNCNLNQTRISFDLDNEDEALSYKSEDEWLAVTSTRLENFPGTSQISASAADLNKLMNCLSDHKIVGKASFSKMIDTSNGYMPFMPMEYMDGNAIGLRGQVDGFNSILIYIPEDNVTISILCNGATLDFNTIVDDFIKIYNGEMKSIPNFKKAF